MSYTPHKIELTVVQRRELLEQALPIMTKMYEGLCHMMNNPLTRMIIRRRAGREAFLSLRNHVVPSLGYRLQDMKEGRGDTLTRGAPSIIIFHANKDADGRKEDVWIALTYGLLAAQAIGLGAAAIGLVPPVIQLSKELRAIFEIPAQNEILASMIVGYPQYRFKGIHREMAGVNWL